jgi:hypothetical protein
MKSNSYANAEQHAIFPYWEFAYPEGPAPEKAAWVKQRPSTFVGSWEPLSFRQRSGFAWTDEEDFYRNEEFSDRALDQYVELGCNHLILPFEKGVGLKALQSETGFLKDVITRAHHKNLKVGVYIRVDSVVPDIMVKEYNDVYSWLGIGIGGKTSCYGGDQSYRKMICYSHPNAVKRLEETIRFAIEELKTDLLHFDGYNINHMSSRSCRCSNCQRSFQEWLKHTFRDEKTKNELFGWVDFDTIMIPDPDTLFPSVLNVTDMKAWHLYNWDRDLAFTRHLRRFIKQLNPDTAISINCKWGRSVNFYRGLNQYAEQLFPWVDMVWLEDSFFFRYDKSRKSIISRVGAQKQAREYQIPVCNYHWFKDDRKVRASLAYSIAANSANTACMGFSLRCLPHYTLNYDSKKRYNEFCQKHYSKLASANPWAEIAVLRHLESLAWNNGKPHLDAAAIEHLLFHKRIPFRVIDKVEMKILDSVKILILPSCESMSDNELMILKDWVERGGRLFFTYDVALFDEYRRRRPFHPILAWYDEWNDKYNLALDAEAWFAWLPPVLEDRNGKTDKYSQTVKCGKGHLCFFPEIMLKRSAPLGLLENTFTAEDIEIPGNWNEIIASLRELNDGFMFTLQCSDSVVIETGEIKGGAKFIHLIQADPEADATDVSIAFRTKCDGICRVWSPDSEPELSIHENVITVHRLQTYAILEIINTENEK